MSTFFKLFSFVFLLTLFSACGDSKPDKLVTSFSDDLNNSFVVTNRSLQINVFENFDDGSQNNITNSLIWSSSNEALATVVNGLVKANSSAGVVEIRYQSEALLSNGNPVVSSGANLEIKKLILTKIILSKSQVSLSVGESTVVLAEGTFDDGSILDVTDSIEWISSDISICSANKGTIIGIDEGNTSVTAKDTKETNITSSPVTVSVEKNFKFFEISAEIFSFNVEQSIEINATVINNNDQTINLPSSSVVWESSDESIIRISESSGEAFAIAEARGTATITGSLKSDPSFTDSLSFLVVTGTYMRLFKGNEEEAFPYTNEDRFLSLPTTLDTFTIKAIGQNYTISGLKVTTLDGTPISTAEAWFEDLDNGDVIVEGQSRIFELKHNETQKELWYFFRINDSDRNEFSAQYIELI